MQEDDLAGGIVDGPDQGGLRPPPFQPVEGAAVDLQQHPFRWAALPPPPVHGRGLPWPAGATPACLSRRSRVERPMADLLLRPSSSCR